MGDDNVNLEPDKLGDEVGGALMRKSNRGALRLPPSPRPSRRGLFSEKAATMALVRVVALDTATVMMRRGDALDVCSGRCKS